MAKRILIVDDSRDIADAIALRLRLEGFDAQACYDGREALELASKFHPQVVILDIAMPRLTGYEAARIFKRHPESTRPALIALSAAPGEPAQLRARMAGFDYYLAKPAESRAIITLLNSIP